MKKNTLAAALAGSALFTRTEEVETPVKGTVSKINPANIKPNPNQPRKVFIPEALEELKSSMASKGLQQPIKVRPIGNDSFELIFGERRWRSAIALGWSEINAIVEDLPEGEAYEISFIENFQRKNLNPIEESMAMQYMLDKKYIKNASELADSCGVNRSTITRKLTLAKLPKTVLDYLLPQGNKVSETHFRNFHKLQSDDVMLHLAQRIVEEELSVKDTEKLIEGILNGHISSDFKHIRSVNNPMIPFKVDTKDRKKGVYFKHTGTKLLVEAKGALPGKENDERVKKALEELYNALF